MKIKFRKKSNKRGFTLIETMFSLMTISIIGLLIHGFILVHNHQPNLEDQTEAAYRWIDFIESEHFKFKFINDSPAFYSQNQHRIYLFKVNHRNNELYMYEQNKGGYMPLLSGVMKTDYSYHSPILTTRIYFMNGQKFIFHSLMESLNGK